MEQYFRIFLQYSEIRDKFGIDGIAWALTERPGDVLPCIGLAAHLVLHIEIFLMLEALFGCNSARIVADPGEEFIAVPMRRMNVRVLNYEPITPMKYVKSNCICKKPSMR